MQPLTPLNSKCAPRLTGRAAQKLCSHFVEMRGKIRQLESHGGSVKNAKTAIPITVRWEAFFVNARNGTKKTHTTYAPRQLEAIVRISESLAKMTLSPHATEEHVDEAIRLFNHSTMSAIQSGAGIILQFLSWHLPHSQYVKKTVDGLDRGQFSGEVQKIEDQIRRRLPLGSRISERHLRDELAKQVGLLIVDVACKKLTVW